VLLVLTGSVAFALFTGLVSAVITQKFRSSMEVHLMDISDLRDHTVICGWNRLGRLIVEQLQSDPVNRRDYIVIIAEMDKAPEFDPRLVAGEMILHLNGDFTRVDVLTRANVARASVAILLADDTKERTDQARDALTVLAALTIEKLQPSIFTCAELLSKENEHHLRMAKVDEVIITSEVAGRLLGTAARNRGIPGIVGDLLMSARRSCDVSTVDLPAALEGKSFLDALFHYKEQSEGIIVGVQRDGSTVFNPPHDFILRRGDRLELLASDPSGNTRA
jgi:voltage-gated potassium channel